MVQITIEYMIMLPLLVMQIFLFPLTASWLMNTWVNSRRTLALQDVTDHLASTIQQLYYSLNHVTMPAGTATYDPDLPSFIENIHYTGNAVLRFAVESDPNSSRILRVIVTLAGTSSSTTAEVVLGPNVNWQESIYASNSTHACVSAEKFPNGTIAMMFGE